MNVLAEIIVYGFYTVLGLIGLFSIGSVIRAVFKSKW